MCGICGIINFNDQPVEESNIRMMMQSMKHRGPDDEGVFLENNIGLGFVRLSILDLSRAGHQPMFSNTPTLQHSSLQVSTNVESDARYVIVYNGEVYNYVELREELKAKGYRFQIEYRYRGSTECAH